MLLQAFTSCRRPSGKFPKDVTGRVFGYLLWQLELADLNNIILKNKEVRMQSNSFTLPVLW